MIRGRIFTAIEDLFKRCFIMKKSLILIISVLLLVSFLSGCATTVRVAIERPAELDLNGAKSVGMLPFQAKATESMGGRSNAVVAVLEFLGYYNWFYDQDDQDRQELADLLTRKLQEELSRSQYLDLVDTNRIQSALTNGTPVPCDVYLTGVISRFDTSIESVVRTQKNSNGVNQKVTYYYRHLELELMYQVIDAQSNRVISYKSVPVELDSYEVAKRNDVESVYSLGRKTFEDFAYTIMKQLQPYTVEKTLTLLSDKHKDPDMDYADEVVKSGSIEHAESLYEELYVSRGYMEAGYNAAILLEAMGNLEDARDLMQEVFDIFKDTRALRALEDIKDEISSANKLKYQNEIRKS